MNQEKTLVILLGNARGGEETWNTMYKYLLDHLNADLALLFGKTDDKSSSLYQRAKYIWEIEEYKNWRDYYEKHFTGNWFKIYDHYNSHGIGGGIDDFKGSGAIIFAFRHYLKTYFREYLQQYDRIILTRSDQYYIDYHPILPTDKFYIIQGEGYGGVCDRHHIFNPSMIDQALGICEYLDDPNNTPFLLSHHMLNPEMALYFSFIHYNLMPISEYCKRVQFTVIAPGDTWRWAAAGDLIPDSDTIRHKYIHEYHLAAQNKNNS